MLIDRGDWMTHMGFRPNMITLLLLACIAIASAPTAARAQVKFTFSPFVGTRFGGRIDINTPHVDYLPIHSSLNWGFNFGARIVPDLFGEFMWNRQTTTLSAHDIPGGTFTTLTNHAHLDMYQGSLLYEIPVPLQFRPFVVAGIGFT